ncbi:MAG TPA: FAD-binding oxidoreductase [Candidatus Microsaccharimonas sp.]|nr:FAD-binding oxidoreductase [Candidatus Microsaccharimonas sp.]
MEEIKKELVGLGFRGELDDSAEAKEAYSHDASMFELRPELVAMPMDAADVQTIVKYVAAKKKSNPKLSLTGRSAGTDMAGGAINESIILSFTQHMNKLGAVSSTSATTQPGVYYRDFEVETLKHGSLMPSYPASRDLAAVGGIANNNSGGEKSLEYGKTADWVGSLKLVFADGVERTVKPLKKAELAKKCTQKDFEGEVYRGIYELCEQQYDLIKQAKPHVSKNSMGYGIWDVWDRETGIFDLTRLIVGAEGTLGMMTEVTFKLTPKRAHSGLLVFFLKDTKKLGDVINTVLAAKPATFEGFDDQTMILFFKLMPSLLKTMGFVPFAELMISLIHEGIMVLRGYPKLILMVEFNGETEQEVHDKIHALHTNLGLKNRQFHYEISAYEEDDSERKSEKFWLMRRKSFQLLRSKVKDKHTAPFIDDFIVPPAVLPEFLPKLQKIIRKYKLFATIAGHMGDGNFHVIPLMKIEEKKERAKLLPAMKEVNNLVLKYGGSLSGEHNDGLVRGPWLQDQFGPDMLQVFKAAKHIMDPQNIFNPHKKSDADWDYSFSHIRDHF